jgi:RepB plasmid partitioning protein
MRLGQLSEEAFELLTDKPITATALNALRWMMPKRQVEAANIMISTGNYSKSFAKALLIATKPAERVKMRSRPVRGLSQGQQENMQQELENLLGEARVAERYGADVLSLIVASAYVSKLISNKTIESFLGQHHRKYLEEFRAIVSAISLDKSRTNRRPSQLTAK